MCVLEGTYRDPSTNHVASEKQVQNIAQKPGRLTTKINNLSGDNNMLRSEGENVNPFHQHSQIESCRIWGVHNKEGEL